MEKTASLILGPNGEPLSVPTVILDAKHARIIREYKKVLQELGLKEALYCDECWDRNVHHGLEARVTDGQIIFRCRCKLRFFQGQTY